MSVNVRTLSVFATILGWMAFAPLTTAQRGRGQGQATTPRTAAPIDLTGYWVSIITEDWRLRMVTPLKGDYSNVPLNREGRRVADLWDPSQDTPQNACKAYGAPAIMRMPVRLHIQWENDTTLRVDIDSGEQTRFFHFDDSAPAGVDRTWQGYSKASWEFAGPRGGGQVSGGNLKVITTNLRAGYLRRNGVPYSEAAVVTEYFDRHADFGGEWITHTRVLDDPKYLAQPHVLTSHFRREPDDSKWHPTPCEIIPPPK
jgi:hypothetical protein